jgi:hypothetical protein
MRETLIIIRDGIAIAISLTAVFFIFRSLYKDAWKGAIWPYLKSKFKK